MTGRPESEVSLLRKIVLDESELECDPMPPELFKKYIEYAKTLPLPKLSHNAAQKIKEYYVKLKTETSDSGACVTTRQLEALIRLSQARARISLAKLVLERRHY